jgi:hypothetical protein
MCTRLSNCCPVASRLQCVVGYQRLGAKRAKFPSASRTWLKYVPSRYRSVGVSVCGASGCVNPAGLEFDIVRVVAPRRCIPAASLHHGRGVCFDGCRQQPHTRVASFSAVQTRLARLWRLLRSSSRSSSSSTSSCNGVPFVCLRGVHLRPLRLSKSAASREVTSRSRSDVVD